MELSKERKGGSADIALKKICDLTVGSIVTSSTKQTSQLSSGGMLAQLDNNKLYAIMAEGTGFYTYQSDMPTRAIGFFQKEFDSGSRLYVVKHQPLQLSRYCNSKWEAVTQQEDSYCVYCENVATDTLCLAAYNYNSVMYNFRITSAALYEVSGVE